LVWAPKQIILGSKQVSASQLNNCSTESVYHSVMLIE